MKKEGKYIYPFLDHLSQGLGLKRKDFNITEVPEHPKERRPDYLVEDKKRSKNFLVEVKQIINRQDREKWAQYSYYSKRQQNLMNNLLPDDLAGEYLVKLPINFRATERQALSTTRQILDAIHRGADKLEILERFLLQITKVSEQGRAVYFTTTSGGFVDPAKTIFENIDPKIFSANAQLAYRPENEKIEKKILLLANQYEFSAPREVIRALGYCYDSLLRLENIDEIYYQWWSPDGQVASHQLIYTRDFVSRYESRSLIQTDAHIFENWFTSLELMGDEFKDKLIQGLKDTLRKSPPNIVFGDRFVRQEMVRMGVWLIEHNRFSDVRWLIEKFINDPDPEEPEVYKGDEKFNYHQQILNGDDPTIITGVKPHLAWVIQKLATRKEFIQKALEYTSQVLQSNNLYIIQQAIIPLIEITARRKWLSQQHQKILKELLFSLLDKYGKYPGIAKYLVMAFYYLKDVSSEEALRIVTGLNDHHDIATLLIYFAIFRPYHFKDHPDSQISNYDARPLKDELKRRIGNRNEKEEKIQGAIAWNFWKLLEEEPREFEKVKPYIGLFVEQPYRKDYYDDIERIIEDWIGRKPEICIGWFEKLLNNVSTHVGSNTERARNTWISSEKIILYIAEHDPEKLSRLVEILVRLWKRGSFVGSPKEIFESYKKINSLESKKQVKKQFRKWYAEMKRTNPKIEVVNWD